MIFHAWGSSGVGGCAKTHKMEEEDSEAPQQPASASASAKKKKTVAFDPLTILVVLCRIRPGAQPSLDSPLLSLESILMVMGLDVIFIILISTLHPQDLGHFASEDRHFHLYSRQLRNMFIKL